MATHDPPLVINREGYRGVIRVQLARKKTAEEEEWAQLKSPSWPPWKEERTGMDAYIGVERGISRAGEVLARMQEAGYPLEEWEYVAQIYAGWDTDRSPTIQTRTIAPAPFSQNVKAQIWAARIDSTRTVYEAWACFLACEEESIKLRQEVYFAMFQKLTSESKRRQQALKEGTEAGEGPESGKYMQEMPRKSFHLLHLLTKQPIRALSRLLWNNSFTTCYPTKHSPAAARKHFFLVHKTGTSVSAAWVHDLGLEHGSALRNDFDKILSFDITRAVVSHMQNIDLTLDEDGFRYLCYGLENAIRASHSILARFGTTNREMSYKLRDSRFDHLSKPDVQLCISAHHTLRKKNYVQVKFWQLVGRNGRFPSLPRLYVTPGPAVLHAYIRALGCLQDFEGLRKLVMWMAQYRGELSERKAEDRNGEDMMRRALIALKLALEGRLVDVARGEEDASETPENEKEEVAVDDKDAATASEETLREILGLVESVEEWGGWPDEEETQAYVDAA
ncbi:hypothetical protein H2203_005554 [Taxawa tesnikishii (nom. ined.)]|nr:hypothetical protein H2203_005554 [Dothideales sp. JES 119]